MQEVRSPNRLKKLLRDAGFTQREVSQETGIPEPTLRHYIAGDCVIPRSARMELARVIGCTVQDLAPVHEQREIERDRMEKRQSGPLVPYTPHFEELDMHFSFGRIKTTSLVLDGDGEEVYLPANIHTHYDPQPATFFDEVLAAKRKVQWEQEEKKRNGEPFQWNGNKYHLSRISISREPLREQMVLGLWFKPRDHYTGLATRRCLDDPAFRQKYVPDAEHDWSVPVAGMSMSMGVDLMVVSLDGYVFLTQRGTHQSVHQGMYHASVSEAVSPAFDRGTTNQAPDLYRCACRGLAEELGLQEHIDFSQSDIQFLSFSVDTHYALYGLRGMVRVNKRAEDILRHWNAGVKDKIENQKMMAVPFTPEDVCAFVFSHEPWAGGLVSIYHALVHEYGWQRVETAISSY